jgi:hypothetical protein
MKPMLLVVVVLFPSNAFCQRMIDWDPSIQLQLSDFRSPSTKIGSSEFYSVHSSCSFQFSFYMNSIEFMATKNFNSKVDNSFDRDASSIIAPNEEIGVALLEFARFSFDLSELYARKFRKRLHEEKGAFSSTSFFKPIFDELQKELNVRYDLAGTKTDIGRKREVLAALHQDVLKEIEELPDFCKECKPPKKKKASKE